MTDEETPRQRVGRLVGEELQRRQLSVAEFARSASLDYGTVNDFINGKRWPQQATRRKIAVDLNWPDNQLVVMLSDDFHAESVRSSPQDGAVLLDLPPEALDGLDEVEREEVIAAAKASALARAREIRRRLEDR